LAREATVFTNAIAAGDMTLTSHGAIFSGLYGSWNGAHIVSDHIVVRGSLSTTAMPISRDVPTMPEILSGLGYFTMAIVANTGFLVQNYGFARGFDYFDSRDTNPEKIADKNRLNNSDAAPIGNSRCIDGSQFRRAEDINREAFQLLNSKRISERPFFLFLNYM